MIPTDAPFTISSSNQPILKISTIQAYQASPISLQVVIHVPIGNVSQESNVT